MTHHPISVKRVLAAALLVAGVALPPVFAQEAAQPAGSGRLSVDVGSDTGPFHGDASGTLYGLYDARFLFRNVVEAIDLRTVSTKAQDGPQHPGADALDVVKLLADASGGTSTST